MKLNKIQSVGGKIAKIRFGLGLTIVGLVFALLGGIITFKNSGEDINYIETTATVTEVYDEVDDMGNRNVVISYHVEGESDNRLTSTISSYGLGETFEIYYNEADPWEFTTSKNGDKIIPVVILIIGVGAVIGGVVLLVKTFKEKNSDQLQQVNMDNVTQEQIDEIKNNTQPMTEYYFHFEGKLNQSYVLETPNREPVVTMTCDKIGVISKLQFTFSNKLTGRTTKYEVGHTTTTSFGGDNFSIPCKSTFKMNNEDVFKMIGKMGYSIESKLEGLKLNFDISHYGVPVATLRAAGANVAKANSKGGKLGDIPTQGVFVVNCKEDDVDAVALIAFAVSRVDFF